MKATILILLFIYSTISYGQKDSSKNDTTCTIEKFEEKLNVLNFRYVRAFTFNCPNVNKEFDYVLINKDGELAASVKDSGRLLSPFESKQILTTISHKQNYISNLPETNGCYYPRFGFVFYNESRKAVGHLDICLECRQLEFEYFDINFDCRIPFYEEGYKNLKVLCEKYSNYCCQ